MRSDCLSGKRFFTGKAFELKMYKVDGQSTIEQSLNLNEVVQLQLCDDMTVIFSHRQRWVRKPLSKFRDWRLAVLTGFIVGQIVGSPQLVDQTVASPCHFQKLR